MNFRDIAAGAAIVICSIPANAQATDVNRELTEESKGVWQALKGGYAPSVRVRADEVAVPCKETGSCSLARMTYRVDVFESPEAPPKRAIAVVYHYDPSSDSLASRPRFEVMRFERDGENHAYLGGIDGVEGLLETVVFENGAVRIHTAIWKSEDVSWGPTGIGEYTVDYGSGHATAAVDSASPAETSDTVKFMRPFEGSWCVADNMAKVITVEGLESFQKMEIRGNAVTIPPGFKMRTSAVEKVGKDAYELQLTTPAESDKPIAMLMRVRTPEFISFRVGDTNTAFYIRCPAG